MRLESKTYRLSSLQQPWKNVIKKTQKTQWENFEIIKWDVYSAVYSQFNEFVKLKYFSFQNRVLLADKKCPLFATFPLRLQNWYFHVSAWILSIVSLLH